MFHGMSIRTKLASGFGAIVVLILVLLTLAYHNFSRMAQANDWDRHTLEVLLETNRISTSLLQIQTSTRGFMLTGNESLVGPIDLEDKNGRAHLARALVLTADNPAQQERLKRLSPMLDNWMRNVIWPLVEKRRALNKQAGVSQQVATAADVLNGAKTIAAIRALVVDAANEETALLARRSEESKDLRRLMEWELIGGGAATVLLAMLIAYLLARAILRPVDSLMGAVGQIAAGNAAARASVRGDDELGKVTVEFNRMAQTIEDNQRSAAVTASTLRDKVDSLLDVVSKAAAGDLTGQVSVTGDDAIGRMGAGLQTMVDNLRRLINHVQNAGIQVTAASTEIAASVREHEATAIEQAQTSVEILATTTEISANSSQLLTTMQEATEVAEHTTLATADAQNNLRRMDLTMQTMVAATDSINAKLAALSEKASNINSVLITITKVADQTNILSLNAAIEAEKAGDAGRGFSVVATEIRRLADQTSVSTWDIEQMLKEMQTAVSSSVMGMDKFSEEIRRSVSEVRQVGEHLSTVMGQVQKLAPRFDLVLQGMQSQAVGASQISNTMHQFNEATQQTVSSLKSTTEAVHQLQYAASDLQGAVSTFSVSDGAHGSGAPRLG